VSSRHPELNPENVKDILKTEIGAVFCGVLEDAGVYKRTEKGKAAFLKFVSAL
jgi:UDPglucose--hexose-1-phosphate uridylyltransferase